MIRRHENVTVLLKRLCFAVGMYKSSVCVILRAHFCSCSTHQAADGSIETFIFSFFHTKVIWQSSAAAKADIYKSEIVFIIALISLNVG